MVDVAALQERFKSRNKITHASAEFLKEVIGQPIKAVRSFYPKDKVPEEWVNGLEDSVIKALIVGSAWPTYHGWELCYSEDTVFDTIGFNDDDPICFFRISQTFELIKLDPSIIHDINAQKYYIHSITYSDVECLDIMTPATKKLN